MRSIWLLSCLVLAWSPGSESCKPSRRDISWSSPYFRPSINDPGKTSAVIRWETPTATDRKCHYPVDERHSEGEWSGNTFQSENVQYHTKYKAEIRGQFADDKTFYFSFHVIRCPRRAKLEHGTEVCKSQGGPGDIYGAVCNYACLPDFELVGSTQSLCSSNGLWSTSLPTCLSTSCGLPNIPEGVLDWDCPNHLRGAECNMTACTKEGFRPVHPNTRILCQNNLSWGPTYGGDLCKDIEKPVFPGGCVSDIVQTSGPMGTAVSVFWQHPVTIDNSGAQPTLHYSVSNGTKFQPGAYRVNVTAVDSANNFQTCTFTVTVKVASCPDLPAIRYGFKDCSYGPLVGSVCSLYCQNGYELDGNATIKCQDSGHWDNFPPVCRRTGCQTKPPVANGNLTCDKDSPEFMDTCHIACDAEFTLEGFADITCQPDGSFTQAGRCVDREPPTFKAPCQNVEEWAARLGEDTIVTWNEPEAEDSSGSDVVVASSPRPGSVFQTGVTSVTAVARDAAGNERTCTFDVTVLERSCTLEALNDTVDLSHFDYNSKPEYPYGETIGLKCKSTGSSILQLGARELTCEYTADNGTHWTWAGNSKPSLTPDCKVQDCNPANLRKPANGALACYSFNGGECYLQCQQNYTVPTDDYAWESAKGTYQCRGTQWRPTTEVPDCVSKYTANGILVNAGIVYFTHSCNQSLDQIRETFVEKMLARGSCGNVLGLCEIANVQVFCGPETGRRRRRETDGFSLSIAFSFKLTFSEGTEGYQAYKNAQKTLMDDLKLKVQAGELDLEGMTADPSSVGSGSLTCNCPAGTSCTLADGDLVCVGCSKGYYMPEGETDCRSCPRGKYQGSEAATACTPCPYGTSTQDTHSHNVTQCKELCQAGEFSWNGFVPCQKCSVGTYQPELGGTQCFTCPLGMSTPTPGTDDRSKCQAADLVFLNTTSSFDVPTPNCTLAAWLRVPDNQSHLRVSLQYVEGVVVLLFSHEENSGQYFSDPNPTPLGVQLRGDRWVHLAVTADEQANPASQLYVNGQPASGWPTVQSALQTVHVQVEGKVYFSGINIKTEALGASEISAAATTCVVSDAVLNVTSSLLYSLPSMCDAVDDCASSPCGVHPCNNRVDGFLCSCQDGWTGQRCDVPPDYCINNTCTNGATCESGLTNFTCVCPQRYTGRLCHIEIGAGGWGSWSVWSDCTASCGGEGEQQRQRHCDNPPPEAGGQDCEGESNQTQTCGDVPCPVHGGWGKWTTWSGCSVSCGGATITRTRTCSNPSPQHGGRACEGEDEPINACNMHPCPVHGGWGVWMDWSECSASCSGGTQSRSRTCDQPSPAHGGRGCEGDASQQQPCNAHVCPECSDFVHTVPNAHAPEMTTSGEAKNASIKCLNNYAWASSSLASQFYCGPNTGYNWSQSVDSYVSFDVDSLLCSAMLPSMGGDITITVPVNYPCVNSQSAEALSVSSQVSANANTHLSCRSSHIERCQVITRIVCVSKPTLSLPRHRRSAAAEDDERLGVVLNVKGRLEETQLEQGTPEYQKYVDAMRVMEESVNVLMTDIEKLFNVTVNGRAVLPDVESMNLTGQYYCPEGTGQHGAFCLECPKGSYSRQGECRLCDVGLFQNETRQSSCKSCPPGYTTDVFGATGLHECTYPAVTEKPVQAASGDETNLGIAVGVSVAAVAVMAAIAVAAVFYFKHKRLQARKLQGSLLSLNRVHPETPKAC